MIQRTIVGRSRDSEAINTSGGLDLFMFNRKETSKCGGEAAV